MRIVGEKTNTPEQKQGCEVGVMDLESEAILDRVDKNVPSLEHNRSGQSAKKVRENGDAGRDGVAYGCLLRNEVLAANIEDCKDKIYCQERRLLLSYEGKNLFKGNLVAVGTHHGYVQVWDVSMNKQVNKMMGHSARVGALAWNSDILSSGSRDRLILQRDVRTPSIVPERKLVGHRQEVVC
uniref:Uncharacterized protein n=1 Tax=Timema poppense TaxID=170557 RepID=A0A7R9H3Q4_TIMPO|nr:unnamed protein product [Timema poppensis]